MLGFLFFAISMAASMIGAILCEFVGATWCYALVALGCIGCYASGIYVGDKQW